jgi:hypothetical protein
MMDALTRLFEGNNINQRMTLRIQLKNVTMHNSKTIHSYFSRVNQIKEQIEAIGDIMNGEEMVMTTLNGSQDHGTHLFKGYAQEGSYPSSIGYGKIPTKKK